MSEHQHSHIKTYIIVAVALGLITGLEVYALYMKTSTTVIFTLLYGLSALKFGLVVALFMHLKYDNKALTAIFFSGMVLALGTMLALIALLGYQPSIKAMEEERKAAAAPVKKVELPPGNAANGAKVFAAKTCSACHTVSSVPGATGAVGPKLDGLGARAASRVSGLGAEDYIKQSIENPTAFVAPGFAPSMPALRASMNEQEFSDLVAFLAKL